MNIAGLWSDVRFGARQLSRSPGYAAVVIVVLALGVSANAAAFGMFKAVFLTPLPGVEDSRQLVVIAGRGSDDRIVTVSYPDYQTLRDSNVTLSGLLASSPAAMSLGLDSGGERVWGELVSGNYFQVLGVTAILGRPLLPSDEQSSGANPVAVISEALWRRSFGADPGIVGRTIRISGQPLTIVGVAERGFHGSMLSLALDVFVPLTMQPQLQPPGDRLDDADVRWLIALGRLEPGVSAVAAAADVERLSAQLAKDDPVDGIATRASVVPFWRSPFGAQTFLAPIVAALVATGMLVLLIVCTNLANLVLARGLARRAEIAVRLALGGSRARIVRLLLVESLLLAIPAAALGLFLATAVFSQIGPSPDSFAATAPTRLDMSTNGMVIAFAILLSCTTVFLFGFVPALRGSRVPLADVIKEESRNAGGRRSTLRSALVVVQVAASLLLLVNAGLMLRTVDAARNADVGFDAQDVVSVRIDPGGSGYDQDRGRVLYAQLLERLRADPSIDAVSLANFMPLRMIEGASSDVAAEGYQPAPDEDVRIARNHVSDAYFRTLNIPMLAGREFAGTDTRDAVPVVVVNDTLARRFWGSPERALGKRLRVGGDDGEWRIVVGVARDIKYLRLNEPPIPYFYMPFMQDYRPEMTVHARSAAGAALIERIRAELTAIDGSVPVLEAQTLAAQARSGVILYETAGAGLGTFGTIALVLAAVGIYGLVSYTVRHRRHEIGVRMALGARRSHVVGRFLRRGLNLGIAGATIGLGVAVAETRLLTSLLFGTSALDPLAFGGAVVVVIATVALASLGPAWQATRTDPIAALRHQ